MDKERMGEIALVMLKYKIAKEGIALAELKRELGNIAKAINIPLDELKEFRSKLESITPSQINPLRKK